jgi:hypothetical protein
MLQNVEAEGTEFYYDDHCSYTNLDRDTLIYSNNLLDLVMKDELLDICRPVLTKYHREGKFLLDYLYWLDHTSMKDVDEKVKNSTYTDNDFSSSIKTQFVKNLVCFNCDREYPGALIIAPDAIYYKNYKLGDTKRRSFIEDDRNCNCVNCDNNFTLLVAYLFK